MGLNAAGVDLTALTVLTGAIGLGLGFGLQSIAANFVSGFVLLMDRSIKPGDVISLSGQSGHQHREFRLGAGIARPLRGGARPRRRRNAGAESAAHLQCRDQLELHRSAHPPEAADPRELPRRSGAGAADPAHRLRRTGARAARTGAGVAPHALQRQRHRARAALLDLRSAGRREQRPLGSEPRDMAAVQGAQHHHSDGAARNHRAQRASELD